MLYKMAKGFSIINIMSQNDFLPHPINTCLTAMGAAVSVLLILVAHADEIGTETCAADGSCLSDMAASSFKHLSSDQNPRWLCSMRGLYYPVT